MKSSIVLILFLVLTACGREASSSYCASDCMLPAVHSYKGDHWFNQGGQCGAVGDLFVYAETGKLFVNEAEQPPGSCLYGMFSKKYLR